MKLAILIVGNGSRAQHMAMKSIMLLPVIATLLLGACGSLRGKREIEVEVPPHNHPVQDHFPAESGHKTPSGQ
jgi:hypothetical protein